MSSFGGMENISSLDTPANVSVDENGTSITVPDGASSLHIQNVGTKRVYHGGSDVGSSRGPFLNPTDQFFYKNVKSGCQIYLITGSGDTSTIAHNFGKN